MQHSTDRLPLDDWLALETLAKQADERLQELADKLSSLRLQQREQAHVATDNLLRDAFQRVLESKRLLASDLWYVQSEWTGGPTDNPQNFTLREPNLVVISRTFPDEEVGKYRHPSSGAIGIPHRKRTTAQPALDAAGDSGNQTTYFAWELATDCLFACWAGLEEDYTFMTFGRVKHVLEESGQTPSDYAFGTVDAETVEEAQEKIIAGAWSYSSQC